MTSRMMELARTLGRVAADEEPVLMALCAVAEQELTGRLREGIGPEDCPEAFALAGAWLALAGLEISREATRPESFTAGDVTIRTGGAAEKATLLREQAERILSGWTKDNHFLFFGV